MAAGAEMATAAIRTGISSTNNAVLTAIAANKIPRANAEDFFMIHTVRRISTARRNSKRELTWIIRI